jgi:hypothetical protein
VNILIYISPGYKERLPISMTEKSKDIILVRFEVFTAVRMIMLFFRAEDGDSMFLRNFGIYLRVYTALSPRRITTSA